MGYGSPQKLAKEINRERISEIFELAQITCDKFHDILSDRELNFLKSTFKTKTSQLLN